MLTYCSCWCLLLQGIFRGYDQVTNVILENCCELAFSTTVSTPLQQQPGGVLLLLLFSISSYELGRTCHLKLLSPGQKLTLFTCWHP